MGVTAISVALASFNGAEYISAQLESILAQTPAVTEIVVCDDNSTDGTWKILEEYQKKYPGIFRIFQNEKNLGCAGNFERALSLCSGEIIFLADQDDVWQQDKVAKMVAPFSDRRITGVYSDSLVVDSTLTPLGYTHLEKRGYSPARLTTSPQFKNFVRRVPPAAHDMVIRRETLKYLLPFPRLKNVHDTFIGIAIAALDGWAVIPEALTLFRQHAKNASNSGKKTTFTGELKAAKQSAAEDTFLWNAKVYAFVRARLKNMLNDDNEQLLDARIAHSKCRSKMGKVNIFHRMFLIGGEFFSGNYFRFARGLKSVIQDIFLR